MPIPRLHPAFSLLNQDNLLINRPEQMQSKYEISNKYEQIETCLRASNKYRQVGTSTNIFEQIGCFQLNFENASNQFSIKFYLFKLIYVISQISRSWNKMFKKVQKVQICPFGTILTRISAYLFKVLDLTQFTDLTR